MYDVPKWIKVGTVLADNPHTEVTHIEHSRSAAWVPIEGTNKTKRVGWHNTTWVTCVCDIGDGEYYTTTLQRLKGLPEDIAIPGDQSYNGLPYSLELLKHQHMNCLSAAQVKAQLGGHDRDYRGGIGQSRIRASTYEYRRDRDDH